MNQNFIVPVSVVIPCFNCAKTIDRAVRSVLQQVVLPAEIILVDDASEDTTLTILNEMQRNNPNQIKVVRLPCNKGVGSARNAGWKIATQPYIAFLDADDTWHPEKLRIQYEYMIGHQDVSLSGHICSFLPNTKDFPDLPLTTIVTEISGVSLIFRSAFSTPTVMIKRDVPIRFQEGKRSAEDIMLWQQIAFQGLSVVRLESVLAYVHKPFYGVDGLSAQLWKMEIGELSNYFTLYKSRSIGFILYLAATTFSIIKFFRRILIIKLSKLSRLKGVS
jgi:glycosyltransferase involved in cell wall biosynthesis